MDFCRSWKKSTHTTQRRMFFALGRGRRTIVSCRSCLGEDSHKNSVCLWPAYHWNHALVDTPTFGPSPFFAMEVSSGQSGNRPTLDSSARTIPFFHSWFFVLFLWLSRHSMSWSSSVMGVAWQFSSIPVPHPLQHGNGMGSASSIPLDLHHPSLSMLNPNDPRVSPFCIHRSHLTKRTTCTRETPHEYRKRRTCTKTAQGAEQGTRKDTDEDIHPSQSRGTVVKTYARGIVDENEPLHCQQYSLHQLPSRGTRATAHEEACCLHAHRALRNLVSEAGKRSRRHLQARCQRESLRTST